ncbi:MULTISPECIES: MaoC/PaaZ C-terminal domain-containing protein [unclassified Haladaptatus]|uniref:MaoC/PaaZ C-terminal domain-containing protein n=1 Tax=unclassified Haladaptatus TaxID=2622732 RepID=UPI0023E77B0F|nr:MULTISPECIES: MaoC/PaaZ C-terminal domain-containing protein [unclassified Haladaptatus]
MQLEEGETYTHQRRFMHEDVHQFGEISGDDQPRHTEPDEEGRLMAQGLLTATLPTKLGGDINFLAHTMEFRFRRPVFTGETITCEMVLDTIDEREDRYNIDATTTCTNEADEVVLSGDISGLIWKQ